MLTPQPVLPLALAACSHSTSAFLDDDPTVVAHRGGPLLDNDTEYIAAVQEAGITVWAYTVDDAASTLEALERGVDGIFSDDPWGSAEALNN